MVYQPTLTPVLIGPPTYPKPTERYQVQIRFPFWCYGCQEEAEEGMIVDGASVPRMAWWFLPPDGLHRAGALGHDKNYKTKGLLRDGRRITRVQADALLYDTWIQAGVDKKRAAVSYQFVRKFGNRAWSDPENVVIILPLMQKAPSRPHARRGTLFTRHIYASTILTP